MSDSPPHVVLDLALVMRRLDLDLTWEGVAKALGISVRSLLDIRRGVSRPRPRTARAMDDWLGWDRGTVMQLWGGKAEMEFSEDEPEGRGDPAGEAVRLLGEAEQIYRDAYAERAEEREELAAKMTDLALAYLVLAAIDRGVTPAGWPGVPGPAAGGGR